MRIKPVQACKALGISNFYFIGNPTNEIEFKQMFKKVVGKDENKNAIISENPSDFGVTWEQVSEKLTELQAEYDAQEYARNRSSEYPTWQEQMDMQYHDAVNGTTTWQEAIEAVKTKFPKGE